MKTSGMSLIASYGMPLMGFSKKFLTCWMMGHVSFKGFLASIELLMCSIITEMETVRPEGLGQKSTLSAAQVISIDCFSKFSFIEFLIS